MSDHTTVGFVRSAMEPLAAMAGFAPSDVFRVLTETRKHHQQRKVLMHGVINLDEIRVAPLPAQPDHAIAHVYSEEDRQYVVLAAGRDVTVDQVRQLAIRLMRINWRAHLVTLALDGLDPLEMRATLTEAVAAMQISSPRRTTEFPPAAVGVRGVLGHIELRAHRWQTGNARTNFKDLLKAAESQPQIVERPGGEEVFILGRGVFSSLTKPKSAYEIVRAFASDKIKPRRLKLAPRPARKESLRLSKLATAKQQA